MAMPIPSLTPSLRTPLPGAALPGASPAGTPGANPLGDNSLLSPDAVNGLDDDEGLNPLLQGLNQNLDPVQKLQNEILETQLDLAEARQQGNEPLAQQLEQKLQMLYAQLAQIAGNGQPAGAEAGPGGGDPSGAAAPVGGASGGGCPGGNCGGGSPAGGGSPGGGATPSGGSSPGGGSPVGEVAGGARPSGRGSSGAGPAGAPVDTSNVQISGEGQGADAVKWALSQEGISERNNPGVVRGYSNGRWQAWCADFVSKAYEKSGGSPWGHISSVQGIMDWGKRNEGHWMSAAQARQNPGLLKVGDVVVWKQNGKSHVGLLTGVNKDGTYNTIEGNTSDKVGRRRYSFNDRQLTGFVRPRGKFGERSSSPSSSRSSAPAPKPKPQPQRSSSTRRAS